jgi:hypothetical protein
MSSLGGERRLTGARRGRGCVWLTLALITHGVAYMWHMHLTGPYEWHAPHSHAVSTRIIYENILRSYHLFRPSKHVDFMFTHKLYSFGKHLFKNKTGWKIHLQNIFKNKKKLFLFDWAGINGWLVSMSCWRRMSAHCWEPHSPPTLLYTCSRARVRRDKSKSTLCGNCTLNL